MLSLITETNDDTLYPSLVRQQLSTIFSLATLLFSYTYCRIKTILLADAEPGRTNTLGGVLSSAFQTKESCPLPCQRII